jgi:hypothetical protein
MSEFIKLRQILQIPNEWRAGGLKQWPLKIPPEWHRTTHDHSDDRLEVLVHEGDRIDASKATRLVLEMARRGATIIGVELDGEPVGFLSIFELSKAITGVFTPITVGDEVTWVCRHCTPPIKKHAKSPAPRCPKDFRHGNMEADSGP